MSVAVDKSIGFCYTVIVVLFKKANIRNNIHSHIKIHQNMSKSKPKLYVNIVTSSKLWRCLQSNQVKDCRAGCEERYNASTY
jgi:hypothetical protein